MSESAESISYRIMGIDVSFRAMGLVVVEGHRVVYAEVIQTKRSPKKRGVLVANDDARCCMELTRGLWEAIHTWKPAGIIAEIPSGGGKSARAGRTMAIATGVAVSTITLSGLPAEWVTPQDVKEVATGKRSGSKAAVQELVRNFFDWGIHWPRQATIREHVADAAAAILAAQDGILVRALGGPGKLALQTRT